VDRNRFIDYLARLVQDGMITGADAADLVRRFDAEDLPPDFVLPTEPAALAASVPEDERNRYAVILLANVLPLRRQTRAGLRQWSTAARRGQIDGLQAEFERRIEALADRLAAGTMTIPQWQRAMLREISAYQRAAVIVGSGQLEPDGYLAGQLDDAGRRQTAYLSRYADQIAATPLTGAAAFTALYLANRSRSYGGLGRGLFHRSLEYQAGNDGEIGAGWVVEYVARDDNRTCGPCIEAQGYYLPGSGPYPGEVCAGGGACRCERILIYDPAIYARLTGQPAQPQTAQRTPTSATSRQPARGRQPMPA
jgi:hypothetical protein